MALPTQAADYTGHWGGMSSITNVHKFPFTQIPQAREHHEYFKQFPHGWPIEEFIKSSLKNKHTYAHKQGYFEELSNINNAGSNSHEESLNGDMDDDDELEAENGEFEGNVDNDEAEAGNGEFGGNDEENN